MKHTILILGIFILISRIAQAQTGTVVLRWTAPGDDGFIGMAAAYEGHASTDSTLIAVNPEAAPAITGFAHPSVAGTQDTICITVPTGDRYFYTVRAIDEAFNPGAWSNIASKAVPDIDCPGKIADLEAEVR